MKRHSLVQVHCIMHILYMYMYNVASSAHFALIVSQSARDQKTIGELYLLSHLADPTPIQVHVHNYCLSLLVVIGVSIIVVWTVYKNLM